MDYKYRFRDPDKKWGRWYDNYGLRWMKEVLDKDERMVSITVEYNDGSRIQTKRGLFNE